jgi:hypothetical protein
MERLPTSVLSYQKLGPLIVMDISKHEGLEKSPIGDQKIDTKLLTKCYSFQNSIKN